MNRIAHCQQTIRALDAIVLNRLRALHDACWWPSTVNGRPTAKALNALLREIEELEAAPFRPSEEQLRASFEACYLR